MRTNFLKSIIVLLTCTIFLLPFTFFLSPLHAQPPRKMSYQSVIRNSSGQLVTNQNVGMKISILQGTADGTVVYTETQTPVTNANGLVSLEIGTGTTSDDFSMIDWSDGPYFIKTEIDPDGDASYSISGTSQLMSVPYSFFSSVSSSTEEKQNIEDVLKEGNDANFKKINNLLIGNCDKCDETTKGCIQYDTIHKKLQVCDGEKWTDLITVSSDLPENSVFVSPYGMDTTGSGTLKSPCRSIMYGISIAVNDGRQNVLVANGLYNETVYLASGINLLGGYDPVTWMRNPGGSFAMISGTGQINNHPVTILGDNIDQPTVFQGFVIYGKDALTAGYNSYAVYIKDSNALLTISDNTIYCGKGSPGTNDVMGAAGIDGVDGAGRDSNPEGYDAFITSSSPCNTANNRQYPNGGVLNVSGNTISGGNGGGNRCPPSKGTEYSGIDGSDGLSGSGPLGGVGGMGGDAGDDGEIAGTGICYIPDNPMEGYDGGNGQNGGNGSGGMGGTSSGMVIGGHWKGASGTVGMTGGNGGGGGGGGAGGGSDCNSAACEYKDRLGGHGGGGGSGGGGGEGGGSGTAGGGSFGIFIINSLAPDVKETSIFLGAAGNGGNGGSGGVGGNGGYGGMGGLCPGNCFCYKNAGNGGNGGKGGHGGGGGGGAGGSSFGIFTSGVLSPPDYENITRSNTFSGGIAGTGGEGGISFGVTGGTGHIGFMMYCRYN